MAVIEQLICGKNPSSPDSGRTVLARSPGIGAGVSEEIVKFCSDWGSPPPGGLLRPVVLSFPLKSAMPAIRGHLYAIIRINTVVPAFFHAVVMSKADFRTFDYNPFAVVQAGSFLDNCNVEGHLAKGHIESLGPDNLFSPPPNPADVGLVDEALQQFLTKGKLILNLEASTEQSDRVLSLMIHLMPLTQKERLRFASFSTSGDNHYSLATAYTLDTPFSSWHRLFMTLIDQGTPESVRKYIATVRNGLAVGDLGNLNKSSVTTVPQPRKTTSQRGPVQEPISNRSVPFIQETAPPRQPPLSTGAGPTPNRVAVTPMTAVIGSSSSGPGLNSPSSSRVGIGKARPSRTRLVRQSMPMSRKAVRKQSHALLTFFVAVAVLAAGWVYLDRSGKGQEWGVFDLLNRASRQEPDSKAASLLEVVDVGAEYSRQLGKIQRAKLLPGSDRDQAMRRAQADLQADAAGPLLIQADLFLQLTDSGIQQGSRPDREMARLQSLANQGQVLVEEMSRLELAYYSFQQGILWQDLGTLPDAQVRARRDSLVKAAPKQMGTVTQEVGTGPYWTSLPAARNNAAGMAGLLTLFQSDSWSKDWESGMKRAAEMVSPTASPMSRAYRNNAFTLVRLKRAERQEANLSGSYNRPFGKGVWPAESVQEILAELRRRASLFTSQERPALLSEILVLYAGLSDPEPVAKKFAVSELTQAKFEQNLAVKFDPAVYDNYLSRVRFEAMKQLLDSGTDPAELPARLLRGNDPQVVAFFNDLLKENENTANWPAMTAMAGDGFLGRWSLRQEKLVQSRTASMRNDIDKAWAESQDLLGQLMERASRGEDWTSIWVDLQGELSQILAYSPSIIQSDSSGASWWTQAADLKAQLDVSRPLEFQSVVVRLGPQPLPEPVRVFLELQVDKDGRSFESPLFALGPSAPEGSGWVGNTDLDWQPEISPADSFTARVFLPSQDSPLVEVNYPSLVERVGPGALVRSRTSDSGSMVFHITDKWWRTIQILEVP